MESIKNKLTDYESGSELAVMLTKKDSEKFPVVLQCFIDSGNEVIAKELQKYLDGGSTAAQPIWFNTKNPTDFYIGRGKEMETLDNLWETCSQKKIFQFVSLTGLGGVGKSELAKNYAKLFHNDVHGHVIWIDAETNQSLTQSFTNLAESVLDISTTDEFGVEKGLETLCREIYEALSGKKCLLVFDNVEDYAHSVLKQLYDFASSQPPAEHKPFVIMTSRLANVKKYFGIKCIHVELDVLGKDAATKFFSKSLDYDGTAISENALENIEKLCERLQYYPLAMHQAVAYIQENLLYSSDLETELTDYLFEIEKEAKILLTHTIPPENSVSNTTFLTWGVTFEKLKKTNTIGLEAIGIMNIVSFLSPDHISSQFVTELTKKIEGTSTSTSSSEEAFKLLGNHSMIKFNRKTIFSIHRLVQEVTRIGLKESGELDTFLDKLVQCATGMLNDKKIHLEQLNHMVTIWEHLAKSKELVKSHTEFPELISNKFYDSGKFRESYDFTSGVVEVMKKLLGNENRGTWRMSWRKGAALKAMGEYNKSLQLLTEVHENQKLLFGEEDNHTLLTAREIGFVEYRLRNNEGALKRYGSALAIRQKVNGPEFRETLYLQHHIALVLQTQEKYEEATKLYETVLKVQEELFGSGDHDTMITKYNYASVKFARKDYSEALRIWKDVLQVQETAMEMDHPTSLLTKYNIARTYNCIGRQGDSLTLAREVFRKQEELLGTQHPNTIQTKNLLEELLRK